MSTAPWNEGVIVLRKLLEKEKFNLEEYKRDKENFQIKMKNTDTYIIESERKIKEFEAAILKLNQS